MNWEDSAKDAALADGNWPSSVNFCVPLHRSWHCKVAHTDVHRHKLQLLIS